MRLALDIPGKEPTGVAVGEQVGEEDTTQEEVAEVVEAEVGVGAGVEDILRQDG